jgi:hypothetical protein
MLPYLAPICSANQRGGVLMPRMLNSKMPLRNTRIAALATP